MNPTQKKLITNLVNKIDKKLDFDSLPGIIFDNDDLNNTKMDIAKQCSEIKNTLSEKEKQLYEKNSTTIVNYIIRKAGI